MGIYCFLFESHDFQQNVRKPGLPGYLLFSCLLLFWYEEVKRIHSVLEAEGQIKCFHIFPRQVSKLIITT